MAIDYPCSMHKDSYANSTTAIDEQEYKALSKDGWLTSQEWDDKGKTPKKRIRNTPFEE
jgi:hypothetical protein